MRLNLNGAFTVLQGNGIAEAILIFAAQDNERLFTELRDQLEQAGLHITPASLADATAPICSPTPQTVYENLLATYQRDLVAVSAPDIGASVQIMAMERGPKII